MKKITAIILLICLCAMPLSACSSGSTAIYTSNWGKSDVYEKSVYTVSIDMGEDSSFTNAPTLSGNGTYTSIIEGDYKTGYTLSTEFVFKGSYRFNDGKEVDVNDKITTKVLFADATKALAPSYSERTYTGTTIEYLADGTFAVSPLSYKQSVVYNTKKAEVSLYKADDKGNFTEKYSNFDTVRDMSFKTTPVDNEMLAVVLRSLSKSTNYSLSLNVLAPTLSEVSAVTLSIPKNDGTKELSISINGKTETINCYVLTLSTAGSIGGSALTYYFGNGDKGEVTNEVGGKISVDRSRLIAMRQNVPYSNDYFVYTLSEYTYGK